MERDLANALERIEKKVDKLLPDNRVLTGFLIYLDKQGLIDIQGIKMVTEEIIESYWETYQ